jgi:hypothetical protein
MIEEGTLLCARIQQRHGRKRYMSYCISRGSLRNVEVLHDTRSEERIFQSTEQAIEEFPQLRNLDAEEGRGMLSLEYGLLVMLQLCERERTSPWDIRVCLNEWREHMGRMQGDRSQPPLGGAVGSHPEQRAVFSSTQNILEACRRIEQANIMRNWQNIYERGMRDPINVQQTETRQDVSSTQNILEAYERLARANLVPSWQNIYERERNTPQTGTEQDVPERSMNVPMVFVPGKRKMRLKE